MSEALTLVWALAAGLGLGALFFGGLWWTVRRGSASPRPARWFLGSFLLRTGMVLAGLHFVAAGHWQRLVACLLGILAARFIVTKFAGRPDAPRTSPEKAAGHAA